MCVCVCVCVCEQEIFLTSLSVCCAHNQLLPSERLRRERARQHQVEGGTTEGGDVVVGQEEGDGGVPVPVVVSVRLQIIPLTEEQMEQLFQSHMSVYVADEEGEGGDVSHPVFGECRKCAPGKGVGWSEHSLGERWGLSGNHVPLLCVSHAMASSGGVG